MARVDLATLDNVVSRFSLFTTVVDFQTHLDTLRNVIAFDGIHVNQAYHCTECRHAATTRGSMKSHWSRKHRGIKRPKLKLAPVQRILLTSKYDRWIPVQPKLNSPQAQDAMTAWTDAYASLSPIKPPPTKANEPQPWLRTLGWLRFVEGLNPEDMAGLVDSVKKDPLFKTLSDALVEYLRNAMHMLGVVPHQVRQILRSITR